VAGLDGNATESSVMTRDGTWEISLNTFTRNVRGQFQKN
jgi:hypothetical protein